MMSRCEVSDRTLDYGFTAGTHLRDSGLTVSSVSIHVLILKLCFISVLLMK